MEGKDCTIVLVNTNEIAYLKKIYNGLLYTLTCYYKTDEITITMQIKATRKE